MNFIALTGWVVQPADRRRRTDGTEVLTWRGGARSRSGSEHIFNLAITDPKLIDTAEAALQPGRAYLIEDAELVTRPYNKRGVTVADIEVIEVHAIRFSKAAAAAESAAQEAAKAS